MLLAIDTSTPTVTVAVHGDESGGGVRSAQEGTERQKHTERLTPTIEAALIEAGVERRELTRIAVGVGPGPFTGLRVGLVTARVLGFTLGIDVVGVCSLDVTAQASDTDDLVVAHDARRREVYWARYAAGQRIEGPHVGPAVDIPAGWPGAGPGAGMLAEAFTEVLHEQPPSAAVLARAVVERTVSLLPAEPLYLRRPDAVPPSAPKSVLTPR